MRAIITVGISGSGKSTWAEQDVDGVVINRDTFRWAYAGAEGWAHYKFTKQSESFVTERCERRLHDAAHSGIDVIISDTNLNTKYRNILIEKLKAYGYEVEIKEFPISFPEALRRDTVRGIFSVGEEVLKRQWEMWVAYHQEKGEGMWDNQRMEEEHE